MKICIELDEETQEKWKLAKQELEDSFEYVHEKNVSLSDRTVFRGLLYCFERGLSESFSVSFASKLSEEEAGILSKRKPSIN
ncbi:MAG: hypothetical protein WAL97_07415 [Halobacteriota archaeon]